MIEPIIIYHRSLVFPIDMRPTIEDLILDCRRSRKGQQKAMLCSQLGVIEQQFVRDCVARSHFWGILWVLGRWLSLFGDYDIE